MEAKECIAEYHEIVIRLHFRSQLQASSIRILTQRKGTWLYIFDSYGHMTGRETRAL